MDGLKLSLCFGLCRTLSLTLAATPTPTRARAYAWLQLLTESPHSNPSDKYSVAVATVGTRAEGRFVAVVGL